MSENKQQAPEQIWLIPQNPDGSLWPKRVWNEKIPAAPIGYIREDLVPVVQPPEPDARLWGELFLDATGEAHFICHTKDENFPATKAAFEKFIALLQRQIANERECPFYAAAPLQPPSQQSVPYCWVCRSHHELTADKCPAMAGVG